MTHHFVKAEENYVEEAEMILFSGVMIILLLL